MEFEQITRITYLITHRQTGTLDEEGNAELEMWLSEREQHRQLWEELNRRHCFSEKQIEEQLWDSVSAFQKVRIRKHSQEYRIRMRRVRAGVAAVVILLTGVALALLFSGPENGGDVLLAESVELAAGGSKAILVLSDGQRMELGQHTPDSVMEGRGIRLRTNEGEIRYEGVKEKIIPEYNILEVPRKGEFRLVLADGTKVWMNSESRIRYPVSFRGSERRVYLEGEAYFEVSKDKERVFIVDMGKTCIQVLGTSFNARAYKGEARVYATLAEGQIQFISGRQSLILNPEEQGIADLNDGQLTKKKTDIHLYTGWREGRFIFQQQTLEEMMNTLSRWYDIQVFFENSVVRNITFSGDLKRYDSFDKIIEMLEMTGMAHFKVEGGTIFISE